MPQLSLLRLAPQRVLNSVVAALLLLTTPTLAPASTAPIPQASIALDDSATASQLAPLLPVNVTFHDRMGTAVFAQLPAPLSTDHATPMNDYRAGDVAYVTAEQSIVVFLTDGTAVPDHGLTLLGHLTAGLDELVDCARDCAVELVATRTG
ncbi:cyclophilin-like fold protein [Microbacterium trichothecenolyticum]|uniref:Cyclophilin-like domain-containing protein n=1 Tax=Microbacterium trichothecenolyticum TaxID=69370 RepID=A0A0M2HC37_MICTR|nr:cyclophilin-like fold protein [Microbacterium trichothecenolyticum]KJL44151.1 hypothetical protein RS82_01114 [Microbacterium trichothecenolyticum]